MLIESKTPWQLTRLLMIACWVLWIVTFFITVTLFQAVLGIHVVGQVVRRDPMWFNEDLLIATPMRVASVERIEEMLIRYYIDMRYSVLPDVDEMRRRWGERGVVAYLSSPRVYREFLPDKNVLNTIEKGGKLSVVDILEVKRHPDYYEVDFDIHDFDGVSQWKKTSKRVIAGFTHQPDRALLGAGIGNPRGFVVTRVDEREKKSGIQ